MSHRRKHERPVFKPRKTLFCHYQYDRSANTRLKKIVRYTKSPNAQLREAKCLLRVLCEMTGKDESCEEPSSETQFFKEESPKEEDPEEASFEDTTEEDTIEEDTTEEDSTEEASSEQEYSETDSFEEIRTENEPINLQQRVILRRRDLSSLRLVAVHKFHQDIEELANEELELATDDMDHTSPENIKLRLGIRAFYQE